METEELVIEALDRLSQLSSANDMNPRKLVSNIGIDDHGYFSRFLEEQSEKLLEVGALRNLFVEGTYGVDIIDSMGVAMLQGVLLGYQIALLREEEE